MYSNLMMDSQLYSIPNRTVIGDADFYKRQIAQKTVENLIRDKDGQKLGLPSYDNTELKHVDSLRKSSPSQTSKFMQQNNKSMNRKKNGARVKLDDANLEQFVKGIQERIKKNQELLKDNIIYNPYDNVIPTKNAASNASIYPIAPLIRGHSDEKKLQLYEKFMKHWQIHDRKSQKIISFRESCKKSSRANTSFG